MINPKYLREIYKLKSIIRYNTRRHLKNESVAEHSFYVALLTLKLCEINKLNDKITFDALIKALLHDMPEIELNDITHDAKERLNLKNYLKKYEDEYYDRNFAHYATLMKSQKGIAQTVVDIADALSVYQYADNELILGNKDDEMQEIYDDSVKRITANCKKLHSQLYLKRWHDEHK